MRLIRFTEEAARVIQYSVQEATVRGTDHVNPRLLLKGILCSQSCTAVQVLKNCGVDLQAFSQVLDMLLPPCQGDVSKSKPILGPESKRCIDFAYEEARAIKSKRLGSELILLSLMRSDDLELRGIFDGFGLYLEMVRKEVSQLKTKPGLQPSIS